MSVVVSAVAAAFVEGATTAIILTAVTEVGVALSVVGAVTKSSELSKLGGVMSLVGGVGGLANGLATGAFGAAAAGAGEGAVADAAGAEAGTGAEAGWANMASDAVSGINAGAAPAIDFAGAGAAATGAAATTPGLAAGNSLESFLGSSAPASTSASGVTGLVPDAAGKVAVDTTSPYLNDYGLPTGGATDKVLGVQGPTGIMGVVSPADGGLLDQLKSKVGPAWDSLGPQGKAEVLKSVLAMPGGIQNQKNVEAGLAIQQQKVNQTSYGSQVPTFGIINQPKVG